MRRRMMKSKIHRATVTGANLHYVGSVSIDTELLALADILPYEQVTVLDIDNGARFETYAIEGERGQVCLNGAAARLVQPGDKVIIITYADYERAELEAYVPRVVHVDGRNRVIDEASAHLDAELAQLARQPVVAITVELQPKGAPGGHPHVAQPQVFIDEIEVIVQAFAAFLDRFDVADLVFAKTVSQTRLDTGQQRHSSRGALAGLGQFQGSRFFVDRGTIQMLQGNAFLLGEFFGLFAKGLGQALGMIGEVGVTNLLPIQVAVHAALVVEQPRFATKAKAIKAGQNEADQ